MTAPRQLVVERAKAGEMRRKQRADEGHDGHDGGGGGAGS